MPRKVWKSLFLWYIFLLGINDVGVENKNKPEMRKNLTFFKARKGRRQTKDGIRPDTIFRLGPNKNKAKYIYHSNYSCGRKRARKFLTIIAELEWKLTPAVMTDGGGKFLKFESRCFLAIYGLFVFGNLRILTGVVGLTSFNLYFFGWESNSSRWEQGKSICRSFLFFPLKLLQIMKFRTIL